MRALLNLPFLHILPFLSSLPFSAKHKPTKMSNKFISYAYCTYSHFLQFDPSLLSGPPSLLSFPISLWLSNPHLPFVIDLQQKCCHYIMSTSPHYICLDRAVHLSHFITPFPSHLSGSYRLLSSCWQQALPSHSYSNLFSLRILSISSTMSLSWNTSTLLATSFNTLLARALSTLGSLIHLLSTSLVLWDTSTAPGISS